MAGGEGMKAPADEMARLAIGGGDQRERRRPRFEEPHTRPAHVTDKQGSNFNY
jgi:hypothetical protein